MNDLERFGTPSPREAARGLLAEVLVAGARNVVRRAMRGANRIDRYRRTGTKASRN